jgi:hypothetical protein
VKGLTDAGLSGKKRIRISGRQSFLSMQGTGIGISDSKGGGLDLTGAYHRSGYVEEDLQELESRLSQDINAQLRSKAALLNMITREVQGIYERADARGLGNFYEKMRTVLQKLTYVIPSLKRDIEVKGWRKNPWLAWELDFDSLYYVAAMDHVDFLKDENPLELTYEDFNTAFPWEVLDRIKALMNDKDWPGTFQRLMTEYGSLLRFPSYYADVVPFDSIQESFYWTGDLIVEILSDIMEDNIARMKEEKEAALSGRVEALQLKVARIDCLETRRELGEIISGINGPGSRRDRYFMSGDRILEVSLLETEVEDLLTRQENRKLFQAGRKWELFQSTPRSWFT